MVHRIKDFGHDYFEITYSTELATELEALNNIICSHSEYTTEFIADVDEFTDNADEGGFVNILGNKIVSNNVEKTIVVHSPERKLLSFIEKYVSKKFSSYN